MSPERCVRDVSSPHSPTFGSTSNLPPLSRARTAPHGSLIGPMGHQFATGAPLGATLGNSCPCATGGGPTCEQDLRTCQLLELRLAPLGAAELPPECVQGWVPAEPGMVPVGGAPTEADEDGDDDGDDDGEDVADVVEAVAPAPEPRVDASATPVAPAPNPAATMPVRMSRRVRLRVMEVISVPPFATATECDRRWGTACAAGLAANWDRLLRRLWIHGARADVEPGTARYSASTATR